MTRHHTRRLSIASVSSLGAEQKYAHRVPALRVSHSLITGHLFIGDDMLHKTDFFQEQTAQCRALAARAANKTDREFWLRLAQRWEELLRAKQLESDGSAAEPVQKLVSGRTRFTRRDAA
jgi:hypothetical protein